MDFSVIDVETANYDHSSICQIGLACFEQNELKEKINVYINPETDYFSFTFLHGINKEMVQNAPTFSQFYPTLYTFIKDKQIISHGSFDKTAIARACERYSLPKFDFSLWLDSTTIVRRSFSEFRFRGFGLENIASYLGLNYKAHNALEDAITAGKVVLECCHRNKCTISEILQKNAKQKNAKSRLIVSGEPDPEGILFGNEMVFTGKLLIKREEAIKIAFRLGCSVNNNTVTKNTSILVVGVQDPAVLQGETLSSKHRKANKLIEGGQNITIMTENDFMELARINGLVS